MMAMQYMLVCLTDFVLFPIGWTIFHPNSLVQYIPITLGQSGFYHISMMAIVGVTAWGKTKENLSQPEVN